MGQLLGRWGKDGQPFVVGTHANLEQHGNTDGRTLWPRMNDDGGGPHDNDEHQGGTVVVARLCQADSPSPTTGLCQKHQPSRRRGSTNR
ncbi:hypothetical protein ACQP10_21050 [Streptosporangium sandarakinum]|uniref:hypothetical protein n=1 Tax=Streptosporangium sandarakinum TaxID=1260955 RepID=UPI003D8FCBF1